MKLTCTSGPVPSHWSLYSPGFSVVPLTLTVDCRSRLAFVPANALVARIRAKPRTKDFVTVVNFMAAPLFSFPRCRRESVGAARLTTSARKTFVFLRESPTMLPPGLKRGKFHDLPGCDGGFLTWAAKPRVRRSPIPARCFSERTGRCHLCTGPFAHCDPVRTFRFQSSRKLFLPWVSFSWTQDLRLR